MRQVVEYEKLLSNGSFIPWFLMTNFPDGVNCRDEALSELILEKFSPDRERIDSLTGYCPEVFDESDGYIDSPKAVEINLCGGDRLRVEFHPGDTIFYINDEQIGCTGPHYGIRRISLARFFEYTRGLKDSEKLLLLPMVRITFEEREKFCPVVKSVLSRAGIEGCDIEEISACILENCRETSAE